MIVSIIALLLIFFICFPYGILIHELLIKFSPDQDNSVYQTPLILILGLVSISWLLMLLHLELNVGVFVFIILSIAGIFILIKKFAYIRQFIANIENRNQWNLLHILLFSMFFFFIIGKSTNSYFFYDAGLYHIQNIKWIESYPIVAGLGNLQGRFAFNSNWFLLSALFDYKYLFGENLYPLNIFLVLTCGSFFISKFKTIPTHKSKSSILAFLFFALMIIFHYKFVNSPITDLSTSVLYWTILVLLFEKLENETLQVWDYQSWVIFFISIFTITIKLSSLPIILISVFLFWQSKKAKPNIFYPILIAGTAYLLPWIVRNILLSGTIVYPIPLLHIPWLDWSIPKKDVVYMSNIIHTWAMVPRVKSNLVLEMPLSEWFPIWLSNRTNFELFTIGSTLASLVVQVFVSVRGFIQNQISTPSDRSFFPYLDFLQILTFLYWFLLAPDPRFGTGFFVAIISIGIIRVFNKLISNKFVYKGLLIISCMALLLVTGKLLGSNSFKAFIIHPPSPPHAEVTEIEMNDFIIYQPILTDQCWNAALPCVKSVSPNLGLRGDDFSQGFRINSK